MTRINLVPPEELSRAHLVAEHRELPRIFGMVRAMIARGIGEPSAARIPPSYRLGAGHMTFFCDKLGFLARRQASLVAEMRRRGYKPAFGDPQGLLDGIPEAWRGDWEPDSEALRINRARIAERTPGRAQGMGP